MITSREVCAMLRIGMSTLCKWRAEGIIQYAKIGGKILYDEDYIKELTKKGVKL